MGTWGTGIFQSDYALDVKDTYMDRIRKGEDDESVMNSLIAEYEREGDCNYDDTRYVFWLALAYIQWKTGRLDPMVKERALSCIQDGSELELWKGETAKKDGLQTAQGLLLRMGNRRCLRFENQ